MDKKIKYGIATMGTATAFEKSVTLVDYRFYLIFNEVL